MTRQSRPLRIALVIPALSRGGTEQQVALLATGLAAAGHTVFVVTLFDTGPRAGDLEGTDVELVGPLAPGPSPRPLRILQAERRLHRLLCGLAPDVVHAFLFAACAITAPAAVLARTPVRVAGRRSLGNWKQGRRAVQIVERLTNAGYTAFIANAPAVAADAVRREGLDPERVVVISNALPDAVLRADVAVRGDVARPVVLCVANLIGYKGQRHLIDAQDQLRRAGVEVSVLLAGEGPERQALEEQARRLELPVTLLGARADVSELLAGADIFALPSLHEGMSNALMEAMAAGRACVATDVGGNAQVLSGTGILCRPADPGDLARGLREVLSDETLRRRLGRGARERARKHFSVQTMVDRHVEVYSELLLRRGGAARVRHQRPH